MYLNAIVFISQNALNWHKTVSMQRQINTKINYLSMSLDSEITAVNNILHTYLLYEFNKRQEIRKYHIK